MVLISSARVPGRNDLSESSSASYEVGGLRDTKKYGLGLLEHLSLNLQSFYKSNFLVKN